MNKSNTDLIDILQTHLDAGVDETIDYVSYKSNNKTDSAPLTGSVQPQRQAEQKIVSPQEGYTQAREIVENIQTVEELHSALNKFTGCALYKTATNTVFAEGTKDSEVMFIGEAPGANEDRQGVPFCGDSGKLLDKVIASIGMSRQKNAYITNAVFWRPPGNRRPTNEELNICKPFVEKHIALINPKLIVLVGSTASHALFGDLGPVTKQRQRIFYYTNQYLDKKIPAVVTFHPSYLLRQPAQKKAAWKDMLFIKELLEKQ